MSYELALYIKNENTLVSLKDSLVKLASANRVVTGQKIIDSISKFLPPALRHPLLYILKGEKVISAEVPNYSIDKYKFKINAHRLKTFFDEQIAGAKVLSETQKEEEEFAKEKRNEIELIATIPPVLATGKYIADIRTISSSIKHLIVEAEKDIWVVNPYFDIFGMGVFLPFFSESAKRGVNIKIITRGVFERGWTGRLFESLNMLINKFCEDKLENQLQIRDFYIRKQESRGYKYSIHSKIMLADTKSCYIGSANVTKSSLRMNFELGIILRGEYVKTIKEIVEQLWEEAKIVKSGDIQRKL